jgi:L-galactose dehydrogenase
LLSTAGPPDWHPAPPAVRAKCAEAAAYCRARGADLGKLALQFSIANEAIPTHIVGTASPDRILQNIRESEEPIDEELLVAVLAILAPIHDVTWPSGRPENN